MPSNMIWTCVFPIGGVCTFLILGLADAAVPPTLSILPYYPVYIEGEAVSLICSFPEWQSYKYIKFHKNYALQRSKDKYLYIERLDATFVGTYTCEYWDGRLNSPTSNQITIFVIDPPPAPFISLSPSVFNGEVIITMTCNPPRGSSVKRIQYYKDGQQIQHGHISGENSMFRISASMKEEAGIYSCAYCTNILGRQIDSLMSDIVRLSDSPPAPIIALRPSLSEYLSGQIITVTCTFLGDNTLRGFIYYKDGQEIHRDEKSEKESKYNVFISSHGAAGEYSCGYRLKTNGKITQSYLSNTVIIKVRESKTVLPTHLTSTIKIKAETSKESKTVLPTHLTSTIKIKAETSKDSTTIHSTYLTTTEMQLQTSKASTTILTSSRELQSTHQHTDVGIHGDNIRVWIFYAVGIITIVLVMCVAVLLLSRTCNSKKRKKQDPEPVSSNSVFLEEKHISAQPAIPLEEPMMMNKEHLYSEIYQFPSPDNQQTSSPKPFTTKVSCVQNDKLRAFEYSSVKRIPFMPPVYCTELVDLPAKKV